MNPLMPSNRTTPLAAYIALRDNGPFGNCCHVRAVTAATTATGPVNGTGVSSAKLGGTTTLQDLAHL